jgi:hypothetical protein
MCEFCEDRDSETVSVDFTYIDELGMPTHMCKTVESDYLGGAQLEVVGDLFKDFLLACGFSYLSNKRIKWVDDER